MSLIQVGPDGKLRVSPVGGLVVAPTTANCCCETPQQGCTPSVTQCAGGCSTITPISVVTTFANVQPCTTCLPATGGETFSAKVLSGTFPTSPITLAQIAACTYRATLPLSWTIRYYGAQFVGGNATCDENGPIFGTSTSQTMTVVLSYSAGNWTLAADVNDGVGAVWRGYGRTPINWACISASGLANTVACQFGGTGSAVNRFAYGGTATVVCTGLSFADGAEDEGI